MPEESSESILTKEPNPKGEAAPKLPFYKRLLRAAKGLFAKENFEPSIVLKWSLLLGVNLIVPWGLALDLNLTSLGETCAIILGILGIFLVVVRIDYLWKVQGKMLKRRILTVGAMMKALGQFLFIIDIVIGGLSLTIWRLIAGVSHSAATLVMTFLVGAGNLLVCYFVGWFVLSLHRSLPIIGGRVAVKEEAEIIREKLRGSLFPPPPFVSARRELPKLLDMFVKEFSRVDIPEQERIVQLLFQAVTLKPPAFQAQQREQWRRHLLVVASSQEVELEDVRIKAIRLLGSLKNASFLLEELMVLLDTENGLLHKPLYSAIKQLGVSVHHVVFGNLAGNGKTFPRENTLFNLDFSNFTSPLPKLKTIEIDTTFCDLSQLQRFADYLTVYLDDELLQRQVRVRISDPQRLMPLEFWSVFSSCREVDVYIGKVERVVYGRWRWEFDEVSGDTLFEPEVTALTLPMSRLQELHIHAPTATLRQLEEFCTYAVNYVGQRHLKQQVDVYVYGRGDDLPANTRNTLEHLCKSLQFQGEVRYSG